ncbi:MAG: hypothetical protein PHZ02_07315 [Desulfocapsaceae bacterium]|nr:hypothetical protein [Desulfocapsaceae bacterium]
MANSYTTRLKKRLPAVGDEGWDDEWLDNEKIDEVVMGALLTANRLISGGDVTGNTGLNITYAALVALLAGVTYPVSGSTVALTAAAPGLEQANWIYVADSGVVTVSTSPPSGDYVPLYRVDASDSAVIRIADLRPLMPANVVGENGTFDTVSIGDEASYSNSILNIGKNVSDLGNAYDVLSYEKHTLLSTLSPGSDSVMISHWGEVDVQGGSPNHVVGVLGHAWSSDSSVAASFIGTEGKAYANVNGSIATGLQAFSYLNASDNSSSIVYGISASTMAWQGSGTGLSIAAIFSASGGSTNFDIMLSGAKNIVAWNDAYSGINSLSFSNNSIVLDPVEKLIINGNAEFSALTDMGELDTSIPHKKYVDDAFLSVQAEQGSNANGDYVRFADGTQICTVTKTMATKCTTATGALYKNTLETWTFPAAFTEVPAVAGFVIAGVSNAYVSSDPTTTAPTDSLVSYNVLSTYSAGATAPTITLTAIGRWF